MDHAKRVFPAARTNHQYFHSFTASPLARLPQPRRTAKGGLTIVNKKWKCRLYCERSSY